MGLHRQHREREAVRVGLGRPGRLPYLVDPGRVEDAVLHQVKPQGTNASTFACTIFGERFEKFQVASEPVPGDYEFGKKFWEQSRELLALGKIKPTKWT